MSSKTLLFIIFLAGSHQRVCGQKLKAVQPIHTSFKGTLLLPIPSGNKLFRDVTETIAQVEGCIQFPVFKGISLGAGAKGSWFGIEDRALAPQGSPGTIKRLALFSKVAYEHYTGPRTFYEFWTKVGTASYNYDCQTCVDNSDFVFHWGLGVSYYLHATDNLAFGLFLGFETDAKQFNVMDIGVETLPGRTELAEDRNFRNILFGMGFSTTFLRSPDGPGAW